MISNSINFKRVKFVIHGFQMITKRRSTPETNEDQPASLITSKLAQDLFTPCKGLQTPEFGRFCLWSPEFGKIFLVDSGIVGFGIQNTAQGFRNPANNSIDLNMSICRNIPPVHVISVAVIMAVV